MPDPLADHLERLTWIDRRYKIGLIGNKGVDFLEQERGDLIMKKQYVGEPLYANAPQVPPEVEAAFNLIAAKYTAADVTRSDVRAKIGKFVEEQTGVRLRGYSDALDQRSYDLQ